MGAQGIRGWHPCGGRAARRSLTLVSVLFVFCFQDGFAVGSVTESTFQPSINRLFSHKMQCKFTAQLVGV